jgi:hypothetical protein
VRGKGVARISRYLGVTSLTHGNRYISRYLGVTSLTRVTHGNRCNGYLNEKCDNARFREGTESGGGASGGSLVVDFLGSKKTPQNPRLVTDGPVGSWSAISIFEAEFVRGSLKKQDPFEMIRIKQVKPKKH